MVQLSLILFLLPKFSHDISLYMCYFVNIIQFTIDILVVYIKISIVAQPISNCCTEMAELVPGFISTNLPTAVQKWQSWFRFFFISGCLNATQDFSIYEGYPGLRIQSMST